MTTKLKLTRVFEATCEWLDVAYPGLDSESGIDWEADPINADDWDSACEAAGFDPEDSEVGFSRLVEPRACDTILRAGDIVATSGPGGDVAFLRSE